MRIHASARATRRVMRRFVVPGVLVAGALALVLGTGPSAGAEEKAEELAPFEQLTAAKQEARIELGRRLFFEPMASPSGQRSCASCHEPDHGFSDPKRVSTDDFGETRRHSQAILDTAHNPTAHWDGEFAGVADLVNARLSTTPFSGSYGGRGGTPGSMRESFRVLQELGRANASNRKKKDGDGAAKTPAQLLAEMLKRIVQTKTVEGDFRVRVGRHRGGRNAHFFNGGRVPAQLMDNRRYDEGFKAAFGSRDVTLARIGAALDAYCKTIESTESPYDRYRAGDEDAISASAKRGLHLFEGAAGCAQCHLTTNHAGAGKPLFTDFAFHNTGIAMEDARRGGEANPKHNAMLRAFLSHPKLKQKLGKRDLAELTADHGHMGVSTKDEHKRAFKTPTLRDVAKRGPYMHNGRFDSLASVVRYYAKGGGEDAAKDKRLKRFEASDRDVADIVAFLETLSGDERPGLAKKAWRRRAGVTKARFVDAQGKPLAGLAVRVDRARGDVLPGTAAEPVALTTDEDGWVRFEHGAATHAALELPGGLTPVGGALVPDTCAEARVTVPVKGRMRLTLTFSKEHTVPDVVQAHHGAQAGAVISSNGTSLQFLNARLLKTKFVRTGVVTVGKTQIARYEGWVRSDVPAQVRLLIPGIHDGKRKHMPSLVLAPGQEMRLDLSSF